MMHHVKKLLALLLCAALLTACTPAEDGYLLQGAEYPVMPHYPESEDGFSYSEDAYDAWNEAIRAQYSNTVDLAALRPFISASASTFLGDADGKNLVYSPVNVYMALAMLAEITDGTSRQQVLHLLGSGDIDALRTSAGTLWNAVYRQDGAVSSVLASSLWLNEDVHFKQAALDRLSQHYYASAYRGRMGDPAFDKELQAWLNEQTGGLLEDQIGGIAMSPDTLVALATTVYFRARWSSTFSESATRPRVFHGEGGDITCDFMHKRLQNSLYYWTEHFSAVQLGMESGGDMWLLLPDEGVTVDELLSSGSAMTFLLDEAVRQDSKRVNIELALPKFDVSSAMALEDGLRALGVTDVFDQNKADFTPLTNSDAFLSRVQHDVRVRIDEEGCEGAAYTVMMLAGSSMPPDENVTFTLDRPFLFCITNWDGAPLFVGVVNQP